MPLKENKTQNGVDLNSVDVSKLALVDKNHLLEDLTTKLKQGIEAAFDDALDNLDVTKAKGFDDLDDLNDQYRPAPKSKSLKVPRKPMIPAGQGLTEQEIKKQQDEFEKVRKLKDRIDRQMERALGRQRRQDKQAREADMRGKVFSNKGLSHAQDIDEMVSQVHKADAKELDKLKAQIKILRQDIELDTRGEEQKLLLKHADDLQKAMMLETNQRKTLMGKIAHGFTQNAVNVTSIVAGITAHSPLAGLATKYVLDKIRSAKEDQYNKKNNQLKVYGKLREQLAPKPEAAVEDKDLKIKNENAEQILQGIDDPDQRVGLLGALHTGGHLTDQQHEELGKKFTPPHYVPLDQRIDRDRKMRAGQPVAPVAQQPTQPQPQSQTTQQPQGAAVTAPPPQQPEEVEGRDYVMMGPHKLKVNDEWQEHLKKPKKVREDEEKLAWVRAMQGRFEKNVQEKHEKNLANPLKPGDPNYDFMMDPDIVGEDAYYSRPKPQKMFGDEMTPTPKAPVVTMPKPHEPQETHMVQAALHHGPIPHEDLMDRLAERVNPADEAGRAKEGNAEKVAADEYQTVKKEEKEVHELHADNTKLEKLNEQQLAELKEINKHLKEQINQGELAADAARRETKHPGGEGGPGVPGILGPDEGKKEEKKDSGASGIVGTVLKDLGEGFVLKKLGGVLMKIPGVKGILGKIPGIKKIPGLGKMFGEGAEVAGATAKGAEGVVGAGKVGGGVLSKLASKIPGLGKLLGGGAEAAEGAGAAAGVGKGLLGKAGGPIALLMAAIDAFHGYNHAENNTGIKKEDQTTGDKVRSAVGETLGGILGIPGDVLDMFGINPKGGFHFDNSETLKKEFTKGAFHATGSSKIEDTAKAAQQADQQRKNQAEAAQEELAKKQKEIADQKREGRPNMAPPPQAQAAQDTSGTPTPVASEPQTPPPSATKAETPKPGDTGATGDAKAIPISGSITSLFGNRTNPTTGQGIEGHGAVDISAPVGSPVDAAQDGTVLRANGTDDPMGYGNVVDVAHKDGYLTRYGHLSAFEVGKGTKVKKGQEIAKSGGAKGAPGSGKSTGPHLHFEVRKDGMKIDPQVYLGMTLQKGSALDRGAPGSAGTTAPAPVPSNDRGNTPTPTPVAQQPTNRRDGVSTSPTPGPAPNQRPNTPSGTQVVNASNKPETPDNASKVGADETAQVDPKKMAQYIARMEGFFKEGTIAQRNNNPGNLRPSSKDQKSKDGYRVFDTPEEGWAALDLQIKRTMAKGLTMREFFGGKQGVYAGYAPAADKNDPNGYADFVAKNLNVDPNKTLVAKSGGLSMPNMEIAKAQPPVPPKPQAGLNVAAESTANSSMKLAMQNQPGQAPTVIAPSSVVNNTSNPVLMADIRARNDENTYRRNMDQMHVTT